MGPVVERCVSRRETFLLSKTLWEVENNGKNVLWKWRSISENNEVRMSECWLQSEGLHKDMEVTATGAGIKVPVGEKTLGRLFNVLGETVDDGEQITDADQW